MEEMDLSFSFYGDPDTVAYIKKPVEIIRAKTDEFPGESGMVFGMGDYDVGWDPTQYMALQKSDILSERIRRGGDKQWTSLPVFARDLVKFVRDPETGMEKCVSKGGPKQYACLTFAMARKIILSSGYLVGGPCLYEIIRTHKPCKLHIDVDAPDKHRVNFFFDGDMIDKIIRKDLRDFLCQKVSDRLFSARHDGGNTENEGDESKYIIEITRVDASSSDKWSSHYIVQAGIQDNFHVGVIIRMFSRYVIQKYGEPSEVIDVDVGMLKNSNPYFLRKTTESINGRAYHPILDLSIYTSNRIFRSCGCCKAGEPSRVFVHVNPGDTSAVLAKRREGTDTAATGPASNGDDGGGGDGIESGYKPGLGVLIESMVQDPLFNALWNKQYGGFITAKHSGGVEIGSVGVSRMRDGVGTRGYDDENAMQKRGCYERSRRQSTVVPRHMGTRVGEGEYCNSSSIGSGGVRDGSIRGGTPEGYDPFFMAVLENRKEYMAPHRPSVVTGTTNTATTALPLGPGHLERSTHHQIIKWVGDTPGAGKRRKISFPKKTDTAKTSTAYSPPLGRTEIRSEGEIDSNGHLVNAHITSYISPVVTNVFLNMISRLTKKSVARNTSYYENGIIMLGSADFYCNYKQMNHSTGSTYILVDPGTLTVRQLCFKATCIQGAKTSLSQMWPTWYIRKGPPTTVSVALSVPACSLSPLPSSSSPDHTPTSRVTRKPTTPPIVPVPKSITSMRVAAADVSRKEMEITTAWIAATRSMVNGLLAERESNTATPSELGAKGECIIEKDTDRILSKDIAPIHHHLSTYAPDTSSWEDSATSLDVYYSAAYAADNEFYAQWGGNDALLQTFAVGPMDDYETRMATRLVMMDIYGGALI